ncbi:MAG TPA: anti-sigma regulatory factor [Chloroflexus aurantiacus]|jgi:serine/threonine-protein kinase RsbT|uniref:ATP-binding region ATPase domain protein n=1 Tax=Chloroflexus aurantiacus (strain ATCC 29366 / DSM 635 / J-10-fl) TaxID=324602 RepID=A9WE47_CHLAA|nr:MULTISPECIES: anti-sigma regulatory factor [Chloroflexus]ABY33707.1 ATP-binding region ATPase domain protein [Chloroflexus aurantiacus J-10-fl]HBW68156.1 anti-sigma regulatory factor [Chloroflexus aurantiacus]
MESTTFRIQREADVYVALSSGRRLATELQFSETDRTRIEICILELAHNLIRHAGGGEMTITVLRRDDQTAGIAIEARDNGPGIPDIELALQDGYSTTHSLGAGLPGVRRLMDDFHIQSTPGLGTTVRAVKWRTTRR